MPHTFAGYQGLARRRRFVPWGLMKFFSCVAKTKHILCRIVNKYLGLCRRTQHIYGTFRFLQSGCRLLGSLLICAGTVLLSMEKVKTICRCPVALLRLRKGTNPISRWAYGSHSFQPRRRWQSGFKCGAGLTRVLNGLGIQTTRVDNNRRAEHAVCTYRTRE